MAGKGFDEHPLGGARVVVVTGMRTALAKGGKGVVLRAEYGKDPTLTERDAIQLYLNPGQVRQLADRLVAMADRLEGSGPEDVPPGPAN